MTDPTPDSSAPASARRRPIAVPLIGMVLGVAMCLVSWLVAEVPGQGVAMLAIMLAYATVMRHGQRFETVRALSQAPYRDGKRHPTIPSLGSARPVCDGGYASWRAEMIRRSRVPTA